jgi:hypothetical protein
MRQSYDLPQDNGSRWSHQCPPSHHKMALMPEYVQASARVPRLSQPSTGLPMLSAPVSPYHQQGSRMQSASPVAHSSRHLMPFASMGGGSPQTRPHDFLYGLMALSPHLSTVKMPSVSKLVFYQPACLADPLNAEALANLKATSQDIAFTISQGHQIPDDWGVVHLTRHMDLLAGCACAIKALSRKLWWRGGGLQHSGIANSVTTLATSTQTGLDVGPKGPLSSLLGSWSAVTTKEAGAT